jgi:hypothetical protein
VPLIPSISTTVAEKTLNEIYLMPRSANTIAYLNSAAACPNQSRAWGITAGFPLESICVQGGL